MIRELKVGSEYNEIQITEKSDRHEQINEIIASSSSIGKQFCVFALQIELLAA